MKRKRAVGRDPDSKGVLPEEARDEKTPPTGQESDESEDLPEDQAAQEPDAGSTG
jgi:hypothetical protein